MKIAKLAIGALAGALLIVGGALAVETDKAVDTATSTFTKSNFDYIIDTPSNEQVAEFKANTAAVEALFPVYNYNTTLKGPSGSVTLDFLVSDDMTDYDITFFNPRRVESGEYKEDGIMLDVTAANRLGAKVGDEIKFTFNVTPITLKVSVIYSEVKYQTMSHGVAMAKRSTEMKNAFTTEPRAYQLAFIAAKDKAKCADMLKNYVPWGKFYSLEEYKEVITQSGTYTDEQIQEMYNFEKEKFEKGKFVNSVQDKATYMAGAEDTVSSKKQNAFRLSILFAIIVPLALAGGLVGYDALTKAKDETEKSNGRSRSSYLKSKLIDNGVATGIATGVSLIGVIVYGAVRSSMNVGTILLYSLPAIAAFLIALPFVFLFTKHLYGAKQAETQEVPAVEAPREEAPKEEQPDKE